MRKKTRRSQLAAGLISFSVVRSNPSVLVIECKVAPDSRENIVNQITNYQARIKGVFKNYTQKRTLLLTPFTDRHNADGHLSWTEVYDALSETARGLCNESEKEVLNQFAKFLEIRNLANMKLPSITQLLSPLKEVAPLLAGLNAIFESLRNDDIAKNYFLATRCNSANGIQAR